MPDRTLMPTCRGAACESGRRPLITSLRLPSSSTGHNLAPAVVGGVGKNCRMHADLSRLPAGTGGWVALVNYALALGDLSEVDYLELKGALSFTGRQDRRRSAVVVSRAILGMANRMPDLAEKHLGGSGVVFVGIDESQNLVGRWPWTRRCSVILVEQYVGEEGPTWDHQFINHTDGLVLAVIVDAPQWGDRIHACRKDYSDDSSKLAVRDGEVLVRVPGQTRPATRHDLANLERRRAKAPHTGAQVSVSVCRGFRPDQPRQCPRAHRGHGGGGEADQSWTASRRRSEESV